MRAGDWDTARAGVALSETAEAARTRPSEPSEDVGRNLLPRTSAWRVRFKPIAREASPYVLPQPLRTTHEGTGASRAHATTRASITPPNAARDARDLVSPGVVSRLGTSRVFLGSFSRLLAGGRIRGLLDESIGRGSTLCAVGVRKMPRNWVPRPQAFAALQSRTRGSRDRAPAFPRGETDPRAIGAFRSGLAPASARGGPASVISARRIADFFEISEGRGSASEAARGARRAR